MKNFLSIKNFKELKTLIVLELLMIFFLGILTFNSNLKYFSWGSLITSISIWILSSLLDKEKYFNLLTMLVLGTFTYIIFWVIFNLQM